MSRPIKRNVSELITRQTITSKGRLPAIQHGPLPRFGHGQARMQYSAFKDRPGGKGNGGRREDGPSRQNLRPERARFQDFQGRKSRGGDSKFHLKGSDEAVRPHKVVGRGVSADRDKGESDPTVPPAA